MYIIDHADSAWLHRNYSVKNDCKHENTAQNKFEMKSIKFMWAPTKCRLSVPFTSFVDDRDICKFKIMPTMNFAVQIGNEIPVTGMSITITVGDAFKLSKLKGGNHTIIRLNLCYNIIQALNEDGKVVDFTYENFFKETGILNKLVRQCAKAHEGEQLRYEDEYIKKYIRKGKHSANSP